jgi:hypothetical protein
MQNVCSSRSLLHESNSVLLADTTREQRRKTRIKMKLSRGRRCGFCFQFSQDSRHADITFSSSRIAFLHNFRFVASAVLRLSWSSNLVLLFRHTRRRHVCELCLGSKLLVQQRMCSLDNTASRFARVLIHERKGNKGPGIILK